LGTPRTSNLQTLCGRRTNLHADTNGDAGGNCVKVSGFSGSSNLHSTWDTALVTQIEKSTLEGTVTALLAEFGSNTLAGGVTDSMLIAAEPFGLAKDQIQAQVKPAAVPVIDHFVDVSPSQCATNAPIEIKNASVKGPASFDNAASKNIVENDCSRRASGWRRC
jgi:hypothetical protein